MKHKYYLSLLSIFSLMYMTAFTPMVKAQDVAYNENFGYPNQKTTALSKYSDFQAKGVVYRGTVDVRNNKTSELYPTASAGGNVYFNNGPQELAITGIDLSGYHNLKLSFGLWYQYQENANQNTPVYSEFTVEYSIDGGATYTTLSLGLAEPQRKDFTLGAGESKDGDWIWVSGLDLPDCETLSLRFTKVTQLVNYRLDDICVAAEKPVDATLNVSESVLSYDSIYVGAQTTKTFRLQGVGVKSDVNLSLSFGTNFALSHTTVSKEEANAGVDITVTFAPTIAGTLQDHLQISTEGAYNKEVVLRGIGKLNAPVAQAAKYITDSSFVAQWNKVEGAEKYLINVYSFEGNGTETVILFEDFSKMLPQGDLEIGSRIDKSVQLKLDDLTLMQGWEGTMLYLGADDDLGLIEQVVRVGKKDAKGYIMTPAVNLTRNNGVATVRFKLRSYANWGENDELLVLHVIDGIVKDTLDDLKNIYPETFEYSYKIEDGAVNSQVRIEAKKEKDNRFVLEEVKIVQGGKQKVFAEVNKSAKQATQFEVTGLQESTQYFYTVRVYSENIFKSPVSNEVSFSTKQSVDTYEEVEKIDLSAEEESKEVKVDVAANNVIRVSNVVAGEKVEVYNVLGQIEAETVATAEEVTLPMTKSGIYFVKTMGKTKKVNVGRN